jgi:hypothetical protein
MRARSLTVLLLLPCVAAAVVAPTIHEDTGVGSPPVLAPGQAPPLPRPGPQANPRSSNQLGFPKALTAYAISPTSLRPARVVLGQKLVRLNVQFVVEDSKKDAATGGWGFADFKNGKPGNEARTKPASRATSLPKLTTSFSPNAFTP